MDNFKKTAKKALSFKEVDHQVAVEVIAQPDEEPDRFATIEATYNNIVGEMEVDPVLNKYLPLFTRMFDYLYLTYEQKNSLSTKIATREEDIAKTNQILTENSNEQNKNRITIATIKREIESSHIRIDELHAREQLEQEVIDNLRRTISTLRTEIDFKTKMSALDAEEGAKIVKRSEGLEREKFKLKQEVAKLTEKLDNALEYQEDLEARTDATDVQIREVTEQIEQTNEEVLKQKRNKEKIESQLRQQKDVLLQKTGDAERLAASIIERTDTILQQDIDLKTQTIALVSCAKEIETINAKFYRLQNEFDKLLYDCGLLAHELEAAQMLTKSKREENLQLVREVDAIRKTYDVFIHQLQHLQSFGYKLAKERMILRDQIQHLVTANNAQKMEMDHVQRSIATNNKQREVFRKALYRQRSTNREGLHTIKILEERNKKLAAEIEMHEIGERKDWKHISYLERDRDRLVEEGTEKTVRIEEAMDDLRLQKIVLFGVKREMMTSKNKVQMQKNLFDAALMDAEALKKSLSEVESQGQQLKQKFVDNNHLNGVMKTEIAEKTSEANRKQERIATMISDTGKIRRDVNLTKQQIHQMRTHIGELKLQERDLYQQTEKTRRVIGWYINMITEYVNSRDLLNLQLLRRNEQLALLYDKATLLETTLFWGWKQYNLRVEDIDLLKLEVKRLRQEKLQLSKTMENMNDLNVEVFHLDRDLTQERLKCKLLQDEMHSPLNIHRWRRLDGSDPEHFQVLIKVNLLQKRVVVQSEKLMFRRLQLREAIAMYQGLKQFVVNQPSPQTFQRLNFISAINEKSLQYSKNLSSAIDKAYIEHKSNSLSIVNTTRELRRTRIRLFEEKKKVTKTALKIKQLKSEVRKNTQI